MKTATWSIFPGFGLCESAPQVVWVVAVGGYDFIEVDQGGEVNDQLMVGQEPRGVFDNALFVTGIEAEFSQYVGVDDELGLGGVAVVIDADMVFVVNDEFDTHVFGHVFALRIGIGWGVRADGSVGVSSGR